MPAVCDYISALGHWELIGFRVMDENGETIAICDTEETAFALIEKLKEGE